MIMNKRIRRIRKGRYKFRYPRMKLGIKNKVKRRDGVEKKNQVTESINGFLFRLHL